MKAGPERSVWSPVYTVCGGFHAVGHSYPGKYRCQRIPDTGIMANPARHCIDLANSRLNVSKTSEPHQECDSFLTD